MFLYGNTKNPSRVWIALHGYGQLAEFFNKKFSILNSEKNLVVCPEGLHRFYRNGYSGRVGASWMTKEAREDDIRDNNAWLNQVQEYTSFHFPEAEIVLLGFSQGAATALRWLSQSSFPVHHVIIYAAVFPPDLKPAHAFTDRVKGQIFFVAGKQDEFMNESERYNQIETLRQSGIKPEILEYEGKHDIDKNALCWLVDKMDDFSRS